jgi:hypothetical protein
MITAQGDMQYPVRVRIQKDAKRTRPYTVVKYYADGSKRVVGYWKSNELAQAEVAVIQAAIDARGGK